MSDIKSAEVLVVEAWAAVMADVQAVAKADRNTQQNFQFRGIDAVMNAVGPALRKHGVVIVPSVKECHYRDFTTKNGTLMHECTLAVTFTVYGPSGGKLEGTVWGESADAGDKATAKAHSVAYRTFLLQALTIPTDDPDPDSFTYERTQAVPVRLPMHANKIASLREKCAEYGATVGEVVKEATGGRTTDPNELFADEAAAVKAALDNVAPAPTDASSE